MKIKKTLMLILGVIIFTVLAGIFTISNAATGSKYFSAKSIYRDSYSYQADEKTVWRIYETSSSSSTPRNEGQTAYCLHRGVGLGSDFGSATPERIEYDSYFDFKSENMLEELQKALPNLTEHDYNRLVWLFDHIYIPPQDSSAEDEAHAYKKTLLENAGIGNGILYEAGTNVVVGSGSDIYYIDTTDEELDDIIDVVQQMVIWNIIGDYSDSSNLEIHRAEQGSLTYRDFTEDTSFLERIGDVYGTRQFGEMLNKEVTKLYQYLVTESDRQADSYDGGRQNVTFQTTVAEVVKEGSNYIVGPFRLEAESDIEYTLELTVTNNGSSLTNYTLLNSSKNPVSAGTEIKDLVGIPKMVYVHDIVKAIIQYDVDEALITANKVLEEGKDISNLLWEMIKYVKDILVYKSTEKLELYSKEEIEQITLF